MAIKLNIPYYVSKCLRCYCWERDLGIAQKAFLSFRLFLAGLAIPGFFKTFMVAGVLSVRWVLKLKSLSYLSICNQEPFSLVWKHLSFEDYELFFFKKNGYVREKFVQNAPNVAFFSARFAQSVQFCLIYSSNVIYKLSFETRVSTITTGSIEFEAVTSLSFLEMSKKAWAILQGCRIWLKHRRLK